MCIVRSSGGSSALVWGSDLRCCRLFRAEQLCGALQNLIGVHELECRLATLISRRFNASRATRWAEHTMKTLDSPSSTELTLHSTLQKSTLPSLHSSHPTPSSTPLPSPISPLGDPQGPIPVIVDAFDAQFCGAQARGATLSDTKRFLVTSWTPGSQH